MNAFRIVGFLGAVLAVAACSRVDMIYTFADDVLESRAKSFLDVSVPEDEAHLRAAIDEMFSAETAALAPDFSAFLNEFAGLVERSPNGPSRQDVEDAMAAFRALLVKSSERAAPYAARVLVRHTGAERLGYLEAELARWREERQEEEKERTPEEARAERIERTVEQVERFIPDLRADQLDVIATHVEADAARREPGRWMRYTERRHAALIAFLRNQPGEAAIAAYMVPWLSRPYPLVDPGFETHAEAWWAGKAELVWLVTRDLDADQQAALIARLRGYATDISALM